MLGYLGCWSRGPYLALTVAEGRGPHNITITVTNKRGNLKDGDLFSQGAMRAKAGISSRHLASGSLLDPSPEATWEASPEYGQLSVIGRCHQKSPRLEAPEMHENSTEFTLFNAAWTALLHETRDHGSCRGGGLRSRSVATESDPQVDQLVVAGRAGSCSWNDS